MKRILPIMAVAALTYGCHTSQPEVHYTTIEATIAQAIETGGSMEYPTQAYCYPQLSGMKNVAAQDSLNRRLKLADAATLSADSTYSKVTVGQGKRQLKFGRMYSHAWAEVSYVDNDLVSYYGMEEYDGGAHPSFVLHKGQTLAVSTLKPIPLSDLFTGDYKEFFKQQIRSSEQLKGFTSDGIVTLNEFGNPCDDVLDALLLQMDSVSTTANMLVSDSTLSILQVDFRDFGCPEVMRGVVEVRIAYPLLQPYIKANGYLSRFLK